MERYRDDPELYDVLSEADAEDLDVLAGIITDNGEGRWNLDTAVTTLLERARATKTFDERVLKTLAAEIQLYGGHTITNVLRRRGTLYADLVKDVARHVRAEYPQPTVLDMERAVLAKLFEDVWGKASPEQREELRNVFKVSGVGPAAMAAIAGLIRMGGFASYQWAVVMVHSLARSMLGITLPFAAGLGITRLMGIVAGPIGWLLTALWTIYDLGSPAYRVTVLCTVVVAQMRLKQANAMLVAPDPAGKP